MKNYFIIWILGILFYSSISFSQNYVPNPSFEIYDNCPLGLSQIYYATPWFQPNSYDGGNIYNGSSTDFYVPCTSDNIAGMPSNFAGFQYARSGIAYCGFSAYFGHPQGTKGREYLEVKLNDTLDGGKKYCVELYVSLSENSGKAIDAIGVYFSGDSALYSSADYSNMPYQPQFVNTAWYVISDTANWVCISGEYIAAGGERFITIGNFYPDSLTNAYISNPTGIAYYYIDDVSVMLCDDTCKSPPPVAKYNYTDTGLTVNFNNLSTAASNNWLWYFGDGTSDTSQFPVHVYDSAGIYTVTLIACADNCCDTFEAQVGVNEVGVKESGVQSSEFGVFPNPADGKINIQCSTVNVQYSIKIYNIWGVTVYQSRIQNPKVQIDLSNVPEGIYYLCLYDGGGIVATEKLMLTK